MKTRILMQTNSICNVLNSIGYIAGICYGKDDILDKEKNARRAINCFKMGHLGPFEHFSCTWIVEDISRACTHQLVRHRIASYNQQSQRYVHIDTDGDWYIMPDSVAEKETNKQAYEGVMNVISDAYEALIENGVKPEDARYILPNACGSVIVVTMNLREFINFYNLRSAKDAQWEIRELAESMKNDLVCRNTELKVLFKTEE